MTARSVLSPKQDICVALSETQGALQKRVGKAVEAKGYGGVPWALSPGCEHSSCACHTRLGPGRVGRKEGDCWEREGMGCGRKQR